MFCRKKKDKNNVSDTVEIIDTGWQYRVTKDKNRYGLEKQVGDQYRVLLPTCSRKKPSIGNLMDYQVTDICLSDGLALIDREGRLLFRKIKGIGYINEELIAIAKDNSKRYFLFNTDSRKLSKKSYTDIEIYDDYIQTFDDGKVGILNFALEEELPANYSEAYKFGSVFKGITTARNEVLGSSKWEKPSTEATKIFPESNGFFRAYSTRYGYIRADNGGNLTRFIYLAASDFDKNGIAKVETPMKNWQYIDRNGKLLPVLDNEDIL